ncbi:hypothetical protein MMC30_008244, partial [Trapelia coarctata]|nr:hypothetical protein [Trapelia coarctata]
SLHDQSPRRSLDTILGISLRAQNGQQLSRLAKLDTGSTVDLLDRATVSELGLALLPYGGPPLQPLCSSETGVVIFPEGQVEVEWSAVNSQGVVQRPKTYKTTFLVLNMPEADCLLGKGTIGKYGLLERGLHILLVGHASTDAIPGL